MKNSFLIGLHLLVLQIISQSNSYIEAEEPVVAFCYVLQTAKDTNFTEVKVGDELLYYNSKTPLLSIPDFSVEKLKAIPNQYTINIVPSEAATTKINALKIKDKPLFLYFTLNSISTPIALDSTISSQTGIIVTLQISMESGDKMVKQIKRAINNLK